MGRLRIAVCFIADYRLRNALLLGGVILPGMKPRQRAGHDKRGCAGLGRETWRGAIHPFSPVLPAKPPACACRQP